MGEVMEMVQAGLAEIGKTQAETSARLAKQEKALEEFLVKQKSTDEWIKTVDDRLSAERFAGLFNAGDALSTAIPDRYRRTIEIFSRASVKDPVKAAAMTAWLKNTLRIGVRDFARHVPAMLEENEKLERAFGDDLKVRAALQEDTASEGGNLVPSPLEAEVLRLQADAGIIRGLARRIVMTSKTLTIPNLATGVSVAIVDEEGSIPESEPTFGQVVLTAKMNAARGLASMQVLDDSAIGLLQLWMELATEQLALFEDQQALEGTGTGNYYTGLVAASGVNEVTNGANGAAPSYDQLVVQKWKGRKRATRRGSAWVGAPEIAAKIELIKDTSGRPIFIGEIAGQPTRFLAGNENGPDGILMGFPFYASDQLAINRTVGTSTDCSNLYFGPFGVGLLLGDRIGIGFGTSEHVAWNNAQIGIRLLKRTAILVGLPACFTRQLGLKTT